MKYKSSMNSNNRIARQVSIATGQFGEFIKKD